MTQTLTHEWARFTPAQRMKRYVALLAVTLVVVWALGSIDVIWEWVWDAPIQLVDLFAYGATGPDQFAVDP